MLRSSEGRWLDALGKYEKDKNMMRSFQTITKRLPRHFARSLSAVPLRPTLPLEFKTLIELHNEATKAYTTNPMFGTYVDGGFEWINYSEFDVEVAKCRIVLNEHNISKEDKVALISNNRLEWATIKYATVGLGGQIVPM